MRSHPALAFLLALGLAACGDRTGDAPSQTPSASNAPAVDATEPAAIATATTDTVSPVPSESAKPAAAIPAKLKALGTEPFWSAQIDGARLTYSTPEDQTGQSTAVTRHDTASGVRYAGKLGGAALLVEVVSKHCSDGMSDRTYPFAVTLTLGPERREGCAS